MSFQAVTDFENKIAKYFGAPYGVAVDCCTHAIELCLRFKNIKKNYSANSDLYICCFSRR